MTAAELRALCVAVVETEATFTAARKGHPSASLTSVRGVLYEPLSALRAADRAWTAGVTPDSILAALDDAGRVATERVIALVEQRAAKATAVYNDPAIRTGYHEGRMDALNELADVLRESAKGGE